MKLRKLAWPAAATVLAIAADQWVKYLVETRLNLHEQVDLLPFLALYRTFNTGVAFSMFSSMSGAGLILLTLAVVAFVLFLASRTGESHVISRTGFALIVGGAIGNLIDRVIYGHVIDYIFFHTPVWSFAIFNLADAFITIGAGLVILEELLVWRDERKRKADGSGPRG
jgi:signal peptidase II